MSLSDDDLPEDISFKSGKEDAFHSIKSIKDSLNRDKQLKRKRQQFIEERNIQQKKQKALSSDFLEQVDEALAEKKAVKMAIEDKQDDFPASDGESNDEMSVESTELYIPLSKTRQFCKKPDLTAADFKCHKLYRTNLRRIDNKSLRSIKAKRSALIKGRRKR